ncbi:MAG: Carboxypeptidase regulatory-like domain, partial [Firmicutes bacterium]|nr:Carboxypeptidase regulatory-like domain [Bacillota bacterium]
MNLLEVEKQVLPYLIKLAESPLVQSELQATKVAILNIVEAEAARAIPFGLRTIALILRWIIKRIKGACLFMKTKFDLQKFADEEVTTADTDESSIETATVGAAEESTVTTGIVIINVQDSSGTAMEGATVSYNVNAIACTGTTDTNGQLTVEELPAGTYTFTATLDGYASDTVEVTVVAGETATGTIVLTAETTTDTSSLDSTLDSAIASAASATELSDVAEAVA